MSFLSDNLTKILGVLVTLQGAVMTMITGGAFEGLLSPSSIRWLSIAVTLFGAAITGVGFNNSTKEKVAAAMETAIKAQPPQESK